MDPVEDRKKTAVKEGYVELTPTCMVTFQDKQAAQLVLSKGAYFAVIFAAFGKIHAKVAKGEDRLLHPVVVLFMALPLFVGQMTMIFALCLDMDVSKGIVTNEELEGPFVLKLKYVMIMVLQLTNFSLLLSNTRTFVFIVNPLTWVEGVRADADDWNVPICCQRLVNHPVALAAPCFISLCLRFLVSYLVCVNSMSIIFSANRVSDVIFNALVLTFVNDLNGIYWGVLSELLKLEDTDEVVLEVHPVTIHKEKQEVKKTTPTDEQKAALQNLASHSVCPAVMELLFTRFPFLSRGAGARRLENFVAFLMLGVIYLQQLFVVLFARMTNILPVARDMCTLYRWTTGRAVFLPKVARFLEWFLEQIVLVEMNFSEHIKEINPEKECMSGGTYFRMLTSDRKRIMFNGDYTFLKVTEKVGKSALRHKYVTTPIEIDDNDWTCHAFLIGAVGILIMMIVPQMSTLKDLLKVLWAKVQGVAAGDYNKLENKDAPETKYPDVATCMNKVEELTNELEVIKKRLQELDGPRSA